MNKGRALLNGILLLTGYGMEMVVVAQELSNDDGAKLELTMKQLGQERESYYRIANDTKKEVAALEQKVDSLQRQVELEQNRLKNILSAKEEEKSKLAAIEKTLQDQKNEQGARLLVELKNAVLQLKSYIEQGEDFARDRRVAPLLDLLRRMDEPEPRLLECAQRTWSIYEAELEVSNRIEMNKGVICLKANEELAVELLRIGGMALLYRSVREKDVQYGWARMDNGKTVWKKAESGESEGIELAFDMVEHKQPPGFARLPLIRPEVLAGQIP